jgi:hypothetical protein
MSRASRSRARCCRGSAARLLIWSCNFSICHRMLSYVSIFHGCEFCLRSRHIERLLFVGATMTPLLARFRDR